MINYLRKYLITKMNIPTTITQTAAAKYISELIQTSDSAHQIENCHPTTIHIFSNSIKKDLWW